VAPGVSGTWEFRQTNAKKLPAVAFLLFASLWVAGVVRSFFLKESDLPTFSARSLSFPSSSSEYRSGSRRPEVPRVVRAARGVEGEYADISECHWRCVSNHFRVYATFPIRWLGRAATLCDAPGTRTRAASTLRSFSAL
jgi:hypothetical protein